MNTTSLKKKILVFTTITIIAIVTAFICIDKEIYNKYLSSQIVLKVRETGLPIFLDDVKLTGLKIKFANISIPVPFKNLVFLSKIDELLVTPNWFDCLRSINKFTFNGKMYGGTITGNGDFLPDKQETNVSLAINNLQLSKHEQIASLGLKDGKLTLNLDQLKIREYESLPQISSLTLSINKLTFPTITNNIVQEIIGSNIAIKNLDSNLKLIIKDYLLKLEGLTIASKILKLKSSGAIQFNQGTIFNSANLNGNLEIKTKGLDFKVDIPKVIWELKRLFPTTGKLNLKIKKNNLNLEKLFLGSLFTFIPLELQSEFKSIENLILNSEVSFEKNRFYFSNLLFRTPFFSISGKGHCNFNTAGEFSSLNFEGNLSLSYELTKYLDPTLITTGLSALGHNVNSNLTNKSRNAEINISGFLDNLNIEIKEINTIKNKSRAVQKQNDKNKQK